MNSIEDITVAIDRQGLEKAEGDFVHFTFDTISAAKAALQQRIALWDGIAESIRQKKEMMLKGTANAPFSSLRSIHGNPHTLFFAFSQPNQKAGHR